MRIGRKRMIGVLIVDDAAFMRLSMKMMMEKNGYEVVGEAENGAEAIIKYNELKPDIVTMDITMPIMDGLQALSQIMRLDSKAKVIMITAMGQETMVKEAVISGAKGFIIKPFKEIDVIQTINQIVGC